MKKTYIVSLLIVLLVTALIIVWLMSHATSSPTPVTTIPDTTQQASSTPVVPVVQPPQQTLQPQITSLAPSHGPTGSTVTIHGKGFTPTNNLIMFGPSHNRTHINGTADNVIATASSADGITLTFTVPASGPSGILCSAPGHCVGISAIRTLPGTYPVSVANAAGTSTPIIFTVDTQ